MEIRRQNESKTIKDAGAKSSPLAWMFPEAQCLSFFWFCFIFSESQKDENDQNEEQEILSEMMQVIEQRDRLVDSLEEQRIREKAEDQHFESFIFSRGCQLSRTWAAQGAPPPRMLAEGQARHTWLTHGSFRRICHTWNLSDTLLRFLLKILPYGVQLPETFSEIIMKTIQRWLGNWQSPW